MTRGAPRSGITHSEVVALAELLVSVLRWGIAYPRGSKVTSPPKGACVGLVSFGLVLVQVRARAIYSFFSPTQFTGEMACSRRTPPNNRTRDSSCVHLYLGRLMSTHGVCVHLSPV